MIDAVPSSHVRAPRESLSLSALTGTARSLPDLADAVCARSEAVRLVAHERAQYLAYVDGLLGDRTFPSSLRSLPNEPQQAAFVLIRDCINFGSGFHPELVKRPGLSGARTIEAGLLEHFLAHGEPDGRWLSAITAEGCAAMFGQPETGAPMELMTGFAVAWNELGALLCARYGGRVAAFLEDAGNRAERMITLLGELQCWRDVSTFEELSIPFMKRARLSVLGLEVVAREHGGQRFVDIADVPIFADNLIPHVLKVDGLLAFSPELDARIARGDLIEHGSREEVSIRAGAVAVCARLAAAGAEAGRPIIALDIAAKLWKRGQQEKYKNQPRHRTRCFAY